MIQAISHATCYSGRHHLLSCSDYHISTLSDHKEIVQLYNSMHKTEW